MGVPKARSPFLRTALFETDKFAMWSRAASLLGPSNELPVPCEDVPSLPLDCIVYYWRTNLKFGDKSHASQSWKKKEE